ncbi:hypothetical protein AUQ37_03990 [Candidatus Methanomethylophilus sp. 1R26]|nr:hypothetical protein AUQ37_03990 [Candidatus Methanomethylophilus sp. 1R26]
MVGPAKLAPFAIQIVDEKSIAPISALLDRVLLPNLPDRVDYLGRRVDARIVVLCGRDFAVAELQRYRLDAGYVAATVIDAKELRRSLSMNWMPEMSSNCRL